MLIAPYTEDKKQSLFAFTDDVFKELGKEFEPQGRHSFYNDIQSNFELFSCLTENNEVKGTVALKKIDEETVELKAMYLKKELRGKGYGKKLIQHAIEQAKKNNYKTILLDSQSRYKAALSLYKQDGFQETQRYNDNRYADVFMRLDLEQKEA